MNFSFWRIKFPSIVTAWIFLLSLQLNYYAQPKEKEIHAVLINKISSYLVWPENTLDDTVFNIGVYGDDKFGKLLDELFKERQVFNKEIKVKKVRSSADLLKCNSVFFAEIPKADLLEMLIKIVNKPILTFGNSKGYSKLGIHVNFYISENRIRFEINEDALKRSGLYAPPSLLKLAEPMNRN
ncbi:MAG: YfiR family protein [Bacteroidetes bacterium]|nr:YfiR family protein [Bacteroidota bacterium]